MKRIFYIIAAIGCIMSLNGCKTTEANYKQAYETAREKRLDGGDSTVTSGLKNALMPRNMVFAGVTLPVRTEPIGITKNGGMTKEDLRVFNVAVASFKQLFNATSLRDRLRQKGYDAFLLHNRDMTYYVLAGTTQSAQEALAMLDKVKGESDIRFQAPFPYILRAAHLAR